MVCFALSTLPDLRPGTQRFLEVAEIVVVVIFTGEYLYRLWKSPSKLRFATSPYGLIDLAAILPFYLEMVVDLRSLRVLRIFRLLRLLKLARYTKAMRHLGDAFGEIRYELLVFLLLTLMLIYLSAVGIYYFEHPAQPDKFRSIFDALWWAVTTLTTVGYGDAYPITIGGRVFTFCVLILGLGLVAMPAGLMASALSITRRKAMQAEAEAEAAAARLASGAEEERP